MRVLLQRVTHARVEVDDVVVGEIDKGLLLLTGICDGDSEAITAKMAKKVAGLRIFSDAEGRFNDSLLDIQGQALVVSQFTLYADAKKGRRPSFSKAARPELAAPLVETFMNQLCQEGVSKVAGGRFGASMQVHLLNDGPVTIMLDSEVIF